MSTKDIQILQVDYEDKTYRKIIKSLHKEIFGEKFKRNLTTHAPGTWWIAYDGKNPVAFSGYVPSRLAGGAYFIRAGVLPKYRGLGLQRKMIRARMASALESKYEFCVSDTSDNPHSANNLIREGFLTFTPGVPWGFRHTIYWRKVL